ncbi:MAG: D-alanyl-lipoteichoic acid biosynthesis protein DltD [Ruminococcus flavefaciens]|nr:D-alanyl-lipoteichoic acid biosynthesis protein DltD [Ruminococcus flavefaciens]
MRKVLQLAIKSICVILPMILLCVYAWRQPLGFVDDQSTLNYFWNKEKVNSEHNKKYDVIILGDSAANAAYVPEILSDSTLNLAMPGSTPVENYYVLKEWLVNNPAPEACFISFFDSHLKFSLQFWKMAMFSHRFSFDQNIEILKRAAYYGEPSYYTEDSITDFIAYEMYLPNKYITPIMNAGFNQRYEKNIELWKLMDLHGGRCLTGVQEYNSTDNVILNEFYVNPLFDDYYRKLIELCMENEIDVHIIKLPLADNVVLSEEYVSNYNDYYDSLRESYQGVNVYCFPLYEKQYFMGDYIHLNTHGALKFSTELRKIYSDNFHTAGITLGQVEAINDSIIEENKIDQILKWIEGKNYTLVLNDTSGIFCTVFRDILENSELISYEYNVGTTKRDTSICCISGTKDNDMNMDFSIWDSEGELMLQLENQAAIVFGKMDTDILDLVVIDNYHSCVVCVKSFEHLEEDYVLVH